LLHQSYIPRYPHLGYHDSVEARAKLWLEDDGKLVFSDYRVRLLSLIDETGSLADAAQELGLSYRRAWGKVREIEENLGLKLVESAAGGSRGGGSHLTTDGRRLVTTYTRFRASVDRLIRTEFGSHFRE
jgi:molybdate transport system regulatory protein